MLVDHPMVQKNGQTFLTTPNMFFFGIYFQKKMKQKQNFYYSRKNAEQKRIVFRK